MYATPIWEHKQNNYSVNRITCNHTEHNHYVKPFTSTVYDISLLPRSTLCFIAVDASVRHHYCHGGVVAYLETECGEKYMLIFGIPLTVYEDEDIKFITEWMDEKGRESEFKSRVHSMRTTFAETEVLGIALKMLNNNNIIFHPNLTVYSDSELMNIAWRHLMFNEPLVSDGDCVISEYMAQYTEMTMIANIYHVRSHIWNDSVDFTVIKQMSYSGNHLADRLARDGVTSIIVYHIDWSNRWTIENN